jgi:ribonuclease HI
MAAPTLSIHVDGASRGNPGPAGLGVYGFNYVTKETVISEGVFFGTATNNVAEYGALALAVHTLTEKPWDGPIVIHADSELLVKQINGIYRVKNEALRRWHTLVISLKLKVPFTLKHVRREFNGEADARANQGVDTKLPPSASFIALLKKHHIPVPSF